MRRDLERIFDHRRERLAAELPDRPEVVPAGEIRPLAASARGREPNPWWTPESDTRRA